MGRIAPRKRKTTQVCQPLLRICRHLGQRLKPGQTSAMSMTPREPDELLPQRKNSRGKELKALWLKIWHLPDNFNWMAPLPGFHRRWLIIFAAMLFLSLLWPYSDNNSPSSLPLTQRQNDGLLQAQLQNDNQQSSLSSEDGDWQRYQIQAGQTLAQLFRDHNLPVNEVFAMAQVEGGDKPLSNLKVGQEVRIARNANGVIVALSITTADNREVLFRRQADGSYLRIR